MRQRHVARHAEPDTAATSLGREKRREHFGRVVVGKSAAIVTIEAIDEVWKRLGEPRPISRIFLFGLSIYTARRRTREFGIRKVMGASTGDIMRLLPWAFTKPVFWASLIAWPLTAWMMSR